MKVIEHEDQRIRTGDFIQERRHCFEEQKLFPLGGFAAEARGRLRCSLGECRQKLRERRAVRMFIRRDTYGRYVSVLVYLPRDRYSTAVRERFSAAP